ncbi:MAG: ArsR family transcriptional regulator [Methanomassiliicoccales archaeon]
MSEEVMESIEAIREEIRAMQGSLREVRLQDLRRIAFLQVQAVIESFYEREMEEGIRGLRSSDCEMRSRCEGELGQLLQTIGSAFVSGDLEGTRSYLEEMEAQLDREGLRCQDRDCCERAKGMIAKVRMLLDLYGRLETRMASSGAEIGDGHRSSEEVADMLSPLSHPIRVDLLRSLAMGERRFNQMSRELGVRTGHLQFHLANLAEQGYVRKQGWGAYSLTGRGRLALDQVEDMARRLHSEPYIRLQD